MKQLQYLILLFIISSCNHQSINKAPKKASIKQYYAFYLHGNIIEQQGINAVSERYGPYQYTDIIKRLEKSGLIVISEVRKKDTDVDSYASKMVQQIDSLILTGVSARHITIIGASKGSLIAMLTSTALKNKEVNFVLMGNCNDWIFEHYTIDLYGNILSIYETSDTVGGNSCEYIKSKSTSVQRYNEIKLNTQLGHGFLFKDLDEWIIPAVNWAKQDYGD